MAGPLSEGWPFLFFGAAPPFGRVGLCRSSLFARPYGLTALVWPFGPLLSIPQPAAAPPKSPFGRLFLPLVELWAKALQYVRILLKLEKRP